MAADYMGTSVPPPGPPWALPYYTPV